MKYIIDDEYIKIVDPILNNKEFKKIKNIEHHGITRFDHSLRVSYYSYKISKILKLDYITVARGALLHDFFLSSQNRTFKDRIISIFIHPKKAVKNALKEFELNEKEEDIIRTHMFPINFSLPKYIESWIVNFTDKIVGTYEFSHKFGHKLSYALNLYLILLINYIR